MINRRNALALGGALFAARAAQAQPATEPQLDYQQRLLSRAQQNIRPLALKSGKLSGPGWDFLLSETRDCEFVMLGEEHGLAETPVLTRELFLALRPSGFDTFAIEVSAPIAEDLDEAARGGIEGIKAFVHKYPPGPAFYFWRTEAELIAAVRVAVADKRAVLWGLDYEIACDRRLIARLRAKAPASASAALDALDQASAKAWETWRTTHNPGALFMFSGDPAFVHAVRQSWPQPDADAARILNTIEETQEINRLFGAGKGWESNERRSRFNRANLLAHLNAASAEGRRPKVLFKMGESHLMRGVSWTGNFDVGSLVPEIAAVRGGKTFSVLVGGGKGSHHGVLNPTDMSVIDKPVDMFEQLGLSFLADAASQPGPVLIDLRPLRALVSSTKAQVTLNNPEAVRNIHAFDAMIVWNGSTAAQMLVTS